MHSATNQGCTRVRVRIRVRIGVRVNVRVRFSVRVRVRVRFRVWDLNPRSNSLNTSREQNFISICVEHMPVH